MIWVAGVLPRLRLRLDAWRFSGQRADYFDYLQAVLLGAQGRLTVRELFDRDALRHGSGTVRGRLSQAWARACEASGGDLRATWLGCFPADELALVRVAQAWGNARLLACFQALSSHLALLIQARRMLWTTLGSAAAALLVASLLLLALPQWTVPALRQSFQGLPPAYLGDWSRALFAGADWLRIWGAWLPAGMAALLAAGLYSLPRWRGSLRQRLDRFGPWRLYRQVQALRLLALISILLQPGHGGSTQLRPVVLLFLEDAAPWLGDHLECMVERIDDGLAGAAAFDTGLLDRDLYWFLEDMAAARGVQAGLQAVHQRMAGRWLDRVRHQALVLRWVVLMLGVMVVLGIGLWHYAAFDELRRGWMMFHAGS
ncbi:MAG: pilus assembly protein [Castellaniella sp.]|uniref:pilus assembly protein n=1 Tax=Castellaniella sp. TaxID=1955812 RepID=UPI002A370661|nr:pilus assembly protein [Castellaniella sp.]MDY0308510.1 pilus assembly protein [Castellaniella sp.]